MRPIVIGTRGSSLSRCQTEIVRAKLEEQFPQVTFRIKAIKARADENPELPLIAMGGEGVFVRELEAALLKGHVDLVVHSMKDLPLEMPTGLVVGAVLEREDASDVLISQAAESFEKLAGGARIGTSSLRRKSQLLVQRRDIEIEEIRGNIDTRIRKLEAGQYDAIVLAACGLIRLGLEDRITQYFSMDQMLPEPGQGALAVQVRLDDRETLEMVGTIDEPGSRTCVEAERAFLGALGGGCRVPIAAFAQASNGVLALEGAVIAPDGQRVLRQSMKGSTNDPKSLGARLGAGLIEQGAKELLKLVEEGLENPVKSTRAETKGTP